VDLFQAPVDIMMYPDYLKSVAVPVDLTLLLERALYGYYRSEAAMRAAIQLLVANSVGVNRNESPTSAPARTNCARPTPVPDAAARRGANPLPMLLVAPSAAGGGSRDDDSAPLPAGVTPSGVRVRLRLGSSAGGGATRLPPQAPPPPPPPPPPPEPAVDRAELRRVCLSILRQLRRPKRLRWFVDPVTEDVAPGYAAEITEPMDLSTMQAAVEGGAFASLSAFAAKLRLIWDNAVAYNVTGDIVDDAETGRATAAVLLADAAEELGVPTPDQ